MCFVMLICALITRVKFDLLESKPAQRHLLDFSLASFSNSFCPANNLPATIANEKVNEKVNEKATMKTYEWTGIEW